MNRRNFLKMTTGMLSAMAVRSGDALAGVPRTSMGVVQYSLSQSPHAASALHFLDYCHSLGAGGIQIGIPAIVADGPATGRPLTLVGLDEVFGIYATVDEALVAIHAGRS